MIQLRQHPEKLLLASASPRRSELLERLGLLFEICPADVDEVEAHLDGPAGMVLCNAAMKAEALAPAHPDALVLGSDTTVVLGERILGKPKDMEAARATLKLLSGRAHTVYTAVSLRWERGNVVHDFVESSQVCFRELDDATIDRYFELVNPLDKAGSYGIQQGRELIIEAVEGSVENVMGLPIQSLERHLQSLGFDFVADS
ncbi:Maf family protein [Coraliomargarita akajimensis]|uniref:dTTP/UTP pyrophosphatase n=1 Tax=Coraliomargarita akajimensis (strain DSM 45221 / IAM 15411 / JCM 23193 / KCTC 12865 / 04OKA010-24) TaxID=583355 RepID=D5ER85_CORAD|nr:Maf family protein [Coraliomargarita akajimensis]ADE55929.1 maf protein [Coraliomargarita akajimensis DSM 45221]